MININGETVYDPASMLFSSEEINELEFLAECG